MTDLARRDERRLFVEHRLFSATRCRCGWEGDSAITHVLDALKTCPDLLLRLAADSGAVTAKDVCVRCGKNWPAGPSCDEDCRRPAYFPKAVVPSPSAARPGADTTEGDGRG